MISSEAFYKILVLGSDGSVKTTLIDSLLDRSLRKKRRTVVYDAYPHLLETQNETISCRSLRFMELSWSTRNCYSTA